MAVDLKLAKHAVTLLRYRHFGKAAAALGISQPTLSSIAALERQTGMRLFDRLRGEVIATSAGGQVLRLITELLQRADEVSNQITTLRQDGAAHLRVIGGTMACNMAVYPAIIEHLRDRPLSGSIEIIEREWAATLDGVLNDQADIAVLDVRPLPKISGLVIKSVGSVDFALVGRAGHPLLSKTHVTAADVAFYRLIYQRIPIDWRVEVGHIRHKRACRCGDGGSCPIDNAFIFPGHAGCRGAHGCSHTGSSSQIRQELDSGKLAVVPYRLPVARAQIGFVYKKSRPPSRSGSPFHDTCSPALSPIHCPDVAHALIVWRAASTYADWLVLLDALKRRAGHHTFA